MSAPRNARSRRATTDAAGDSVNSGSTDLLTGQVPTASTIVDAAGTPIAYL
jgi:hypothetical protein